MRGKQYLAAIRPEAKVLVLQTMYFADEMRDPIKELPTLPREAAFRGGELKMASQLIDAMAGAWDPKEYRDTYTDKVKKLIKDKEKGREVVTEEQPPTATNVGDLMEMLRRSVEESRGGGAKAGQATKSAAKAPTKRTRKTASTKKTVSTSRGAKAGTRTRKAPARKAS